jgi:hypothetical protein
LALRSPHRSVVHPVARNLAYFWKRAILKNKIVKQLFAIKLGVLKNTYIEHHPSDITRPETD